MLSSRRTTEASNTGELVVKIIRLSPAVMPVLCGVLCRYEGTKRLIHSTSMPIILTDLVLFSLVAAFYTGIVIALASLLT
jgi:hypothetical protein